MQTPHKISPESNSPRAYDLADASNQLRFALDAGQMGVFDWNISTGEVKWTDYIYRLIGYKPNSVVASDELWRRHIHPEDLDRVLKSTDKARIDKSDWSSEYRIIRADGQIRWLSMRGEFEYDLDERPVRGRGVIFDITERKRMEQSLRENEAAVLARMAELQMLYSAAPVGLAFIGPDLRYVRVNDMLAEINGLSAADHVGRTVEEVVGPNFWSEIGPLCQQALKGQVLEKIEIMGALPRDSDQKRTWLVSYHPVSAGEKQVLGVGIAMQDITDRRRKEELAKEALEKVELEKRRLLAVLEALPVGVAITNEIGGVEQRNHAFEHVWGGPAPSTERVADYARYKAWWAETEKPVTPSEWASAVALATGRREVGQLLRIQRFDGCYAFVYNSAAPIVDRDGKTVGCAVAILDITDLREAQEALRTSEERFRQVFQHAATGIAISDRDGRFVQCNAAYSKIVGYSEHELRDLSFDRLIHPADRNSNIGQHQRLVAGKAPVFEIENRYIHKNGYAVWVHKLISAIRDRSGAASSFLALVTDITERVQKDRELVAREAEAQARAEELAALMDAVPAITFISHDPECHRISCSRATRELLRVGNGCNVSLSAPEGERPTNFKVVRDGRELSPEEMPVQLATATGKEIRDCEWTLAFPDGTFRDLFGNAVPLFDKDGRVRGAVAAFVDVTEQKRTLEQLAKSEARLRMAKEAAHLGIHDWDVTSGKVQWDERTYELWGVEPGVPVTYELFKDGLHPDDRAGTQAQVDKALDPKGNGFFYAEYRVINRKDGITRWVAATGQLTFRNQLPVRLVGTVQDITQRKEFQGELERAVAERTASLQEAVAQMEEVSYTISHDLRAPLRAMELYINAILEDFRKELPSEALNYVERMALNAERLNKMVQDVLAFSRIGRGNLTLEPVDLNCMLQQIIEQYPSMQAPAARIRIAPLPPVVAHELLLTQAFSNLITNAVKFRKVGVTPEVNIWAEDKPGAVRIWVEDNGISVDPKYQHRLFNMFERVHPDLSYEGTGVGLAIVRKAVGRMGGKVGVESDGVSGSRFWIELPAREKPKL